MLSDDLSHIIDRLDQIADRDKKVEIEDLLKQLANAAVKIGKTWCGSPLGYHANVFYDGLNTPPQGAFFDSEHGLMDAFGNRTIGNWKQFDPDYVREIIYDYANNPDMDMLREFSTNATMIFDDCKLNILSILQVTVNEHNDIFLDTLRKKIDELSIVSRANAEKAFLPHGEFLSREPGIFNQSRQLPPHLQVLSEVGAIKSALDMVLELSGIVKQVKSHISRRKNNQERTTITRTKVFLGHGRSPVWRELKDFISDRLNLPVEEFNRVPIAGLTNIDRLSQMLETASIAFLIMTGEDEQSDGKLQARMNVVHEAGLFQGRLGFRRAIIVLENGCEEFSNIAGLGQIRFAKGNIKEAFEEVRQVLEREGLLRAIS